MLKRVMIILMSAVLPLCAVEVTVSGIGAGDLAVARETALADALRNAVRQGAGVNIVSESKVKNFQLEYDRVFSHSLGYVKKYSVLEQTYDTAKKVYQVRIRAEVDKNVPPADDENASAPHGVPARDDRMQRGGFRNARIEETAF